jgi:Family of unknown function (DUF6152)
VRDRLLLFAALAMSLIATRPAFAHHGTAGYDMGKIVTLKGTVTKVEWSNPHIYYLIDAKDDSGAVQHWSLEMSAPLLLERFGWMKDSLKVGDQVVAEAHPAKNGAPVGISGTATFLLKFVVNGKPLPYR